MWLKPFIHFSHLVRNLKVGSTKSDVPCFEDSFHLFLVMVIANPAVSSLQEIRTELTVCVCVSDFCLSAFLFPEYVCCERKILSWEAVIINIGKMCAYQTFSF
jgi:hypothetical protein